MDKKNELLRALPKVDECIDRLLDDKNMNAPVSIIKQVVQEQIKIERSKIIKSDNLRISKSLEQWHELFIDEIFQKLSPNLQKVFNGTGVVIHTNLGRSPLDNTAAHQLALIAGSYSNLEFNLETGRRGSRYSLVEEIICNLTGAESAIVVNNNAAAVLIALDTLARGKEVIVSRGQLVEIGGSFRIPDVMAKSGAELVEVGATNRTHIFDYENAITEETGLLLRVHTSNFKIIGFTSEVSAKELAELGARENLLTMEDLGSGSFVDLSHFGFPKEPTVQEIVKTGIDVVTFSGDKLLGGPQAGIIVGKKNVIEQIKKNPLNRALRVDKFTLAALESVLRQYYDTDSAMNTIPTLAMITAPKEKIKKRAEILKRALEKTIGRFCKLNLVPAMSRVGGGAIPEYSIESWVVEFFPVDMKLNTFEKKLRQLETPVIGRMENEKLLIDLRTIQDSEVSQLATTIASLFTFGVESE